MFHCNICIMTFRYQSYLDNDHVQLICYRIQEYTPFMSSSRHTGIHTVYVTFTTYNNTHHLFQVHVIQEYTPFMSSSRHTGIHTIYVKFTSYRKTHHLCQVHVNDIMKKSNLVIYTLQCSTVSTICCVSQRAA
jgi:hypothetical protein